MVFGASALIGKRAGLCSVWPCAMAIPGHRLGPHGMVLDLPEVH